VDPFLTTSDLNIVDCAVLPAPEFLCRQVPPTTTASQLVTVARDQIHRILFGDDRRILCLVGPCSIHDTVSGLEYARRLAELADELRDRIYLVMRVYFEKPRTTTGWKGLIMDPALDGSCDIPLGLHTARKFLLDVLALGLPTATELLDPITPQYTADLICWSAIGARTTESQIHRQMASGLSMPVGFKNGTSGDLALAYNAIMAASQPQTFLGISRQGLACAVTTRGNPNCHLILRGGTNGPNFDPATVATAERELRARNLPHAIMVDCSHANCGKDHNKQIDVLNAVIDQCRDPLSPIMGLMLESHLQAGNQKFPQPIPNLQHGMSITDPCIGWDATAAALRNAYERLAPRFA
jgi:3-deoxy-7-phosphoheptulonate synthase